MSSPLVYRPGNDPDASGSWTYKRPAQSPWVRITGIAGKTLVTIGLLVLGLVAYQLWGTGIQTAQAQSDLSDQFNQKRAAVLAEAPGTSAPALPPPSSAVASTVGPGEVTVAPTAAPVPAPQPQPAAQVDLSSIKEGESLGRLVIPQIGVDKIIVAGVSRDDLKKGPGHFPGTAFPGQSGNAAIAGHRTTFGAPFRDIDQLRIKDRFTVETLAGVYTYEVFEEPRAISPTDVDQVIGASPFSQLTLMACHPPYSARQRIIVKAVLVPEASAAVTPVTPNNYSDDDGLGDTNNGLVDDTVAPSPPVTVIGLDGTPVVVEPTPEQNSLGLGIAASRAADEFSAGWFSDSGAWAPTFLFAALCAAIAFGGLVMIRRSGKWLIALGAAPVFLIALYFFYENFSRLLPPNI
jgi:sortase A